MGASLGDPLTEELLEELDLHLGRAQQPGGLSRTGIGATTSRRRRKWGARVCGLCTQSGLKLEDQELKPVRFTGVDGNKTTKTHRFDMFLLSYGEHH